MARPAPRTACEVVLQDGVRVFAAQGGEGTLVAVDKGLLTRRAG